MTGETSANRDPDATAPEGAAQRERVFLCVVDSSEEVHVALHFAALRAKRTGGRVALLYVIEPGDFQHWMSVAEKMREERREEAERVLQEHAEKVVAITGRTPIFFMREGEARDAIVQLIGEEPAISILVLGAGTDKKGPGPLVSAIAGRLSGKFPIPITVVPGTLSDEQLDALA